MEEHVVNAQPSNFIYTPKQVGLILIDFQRDFLCQGGFGESMGNDPTLLQVAVELTKKVLQTFRDYGLPVFYTRRGYLPDLSDCQEIERMRGKIGDNSPMGRILVRGEDGHGIIDELAPQKGEVIIDKPGIDAFYNSNLYEELQKRNIKYLVVTGVTTEACVQSTVRGARDRGYANLVLNDCVASYIEKLHNASLEMIISQNGIFGWVTESEEFLKTLKKDLKQ